VYGCDLAMFLDIGIRSVDEYNNFDIDDRVPGQSDVMYSDELHISKYVFMYKHDIELSSWNPTLECAVFRAVKLLPLLL